MCLCVAAARVRGLEELRGRQTVRILTALIGEQPTEHPLGVCLIPMPSPLHCGRKRVPIGRQSFEVTEMMTLERLRRPPPIPNNVLLNKGIR